MTDLRPCPFCGSQRIDTGILTVGCCYCGTNGPAGYEGTTETWNDRPLEDALISDVAAKDAEIAGLRAEREELRRAWKMLHATDYSVGERGRKTLDRLLAALKEDGHGDA